MGYLKVFLGHLRVTIGHLRVTIQRLDICHFQQGVHRVTLGHPMVTTIGHLRATMGYCSLH